MARSHGIIKVSIWEPESEFRMLSRDAQRTYLLLISQPSINNCGVLAYTPERWARMAADDSLRAHKRALRELSDHRFVVSDTAAQELLVRTFIKHDKIESQPNLKKSAQRQFREIESPSIRGLLAMQHPWITGAEPNPEPEPEPLPEDEVTEPLSEPLPEPLSEALPEGVNAYAPAAPTPAADPLRTKDLSPNGSRGEGAPDAEQSEPEEGSAAAPEAPPDLQRILRVTSGLRSQDQGTLRQIEPLAIQIPLSRFLNAVEKMQRRKNVKNDAGLLVSLLRLEINEHALDVAKAHAALGPFVDPKKQKCIESLTEWIDTHDGPLTPELVHERIGTAEVLHHTAIGAKETKRLLALAERKGAAA